CAVASYVPFHGPSNQVSLEGGGGGFGAADPCGALAGGGGEGSPFSAVPRHSMTSTVVVATIVARLTNPVFGGSRGCVLRARRRRSRDLLARPRAPRRAARRV